MTLEDFINEKLCPTGKVTAWDETVIRTALALGDMDKLSDQLISMCQRAGVPVPVDLSLPGIER
ncbi:hypothetical protein [Alistipes senegalensis]|uniref:hypothetical protein n=1 Tax=Alistipes senegalensis TaxID=1288121 RepID=UPI00101C1609|nr:hypothetical protein [Alistipes senegalensis]MBQ4280376.1 hypothetical protein [Rikenellaceae bacterium]